MAAASYVGMRVLRLEQYALAARVAAVEVESTSGRTVSRPLTCGSPEHYLVPVQHVARAELLSMETLIDSILTCRACFELLVGVKLGGNPIGQVVLCPTER